MSKKYFTRDGETLDAIAFRACGSEQAVHQILELNPHLPRQPEVLGAGHLLTLPPRVPATPPVKTVRLWGRR